MFKNDGTPWSLIKTIQWFHTYKWCLKKGSCLQSESPLVCARHQMNCLKYLDLLYSDCVQLCIVLKQKDLCSASRLLKHVQRWCVSKVSYYLPSMFNTFSRLSFYLNSNKWPLVQKIYLIQVKECLQVVENYETSKSSI